MSNFKNVGTGAIAFWDFKTNDIFIGKFLEYGKLANGDEVIKAVDTVTGVVYNLNKHKAIVDALETKIIPDELDDKGKVKKEGVKLCQTDYTLKIIFVGKVKMKSGRTFNQFAVQYSESEN